MAVTPTTVHTAEAHRLDAFVDAAFAFAVSLLIIAGGEPLRSFDELLGALSRIPAFAGGFALLMMFWLAHRTWSALQPPRDKLATVLSLAIVFSVLVFVFPLRLLIETAAFFLSGETLAGQGLISDLDQLAWTYFIYGVGFAVLSTLFALLFRHAVRRIEDPDRRRSAQEWARTWAIALGAALVSSLIALTPLLRSAPWLPGVTYWLIPIGIWTFALLDRRRAARLPT
ncbi:TMEM175 family protein [Brevundimonas sp. Root1279]|uniref:TMEM175 family protein n=1 Tax=Brevundimonas sp. Root1279 TaxID=1736443 RepID=UPI00070124C8|nr:TMEM175 family protein [Brevundimonas sp. Root1279]KQW86555.1 hypothetical protein ASC65_01280 [Brevundimonas sp. Root1279]